MRLQSPREGERAGSDPPEQNYPLGLSDFSGFVLTSWSYSLFFKDVCLQEIGQLFDSGKN